MNADDMKKLFTPEEKKKMELLLDRAVKESYGTDDVWDSAVRKLRALLKAASVVPKGE
jgi:hypothetical protein